MEKGKTPATAVWSFRRTGTGTSWMTFLCAALLSLFGQAQTISLNIMPAFQGATACGLLSGQITICWHLCHALQVCQGCLEHVPHPEQQQDLYKCIEVGAETPEARADFERWSLKVAAQAAVAIRRMPKQRISGPRSARGARLGEDGSRERHQGTGHWGG